MYFLRVKANDFEGRPVPEVLINQVRKKGGIIECQTLTLRKLNQRVADSAVETVAQTQRVIDALLDAIRLQVPRLFRVCESVALLDMMLAFAQLSTVNDYVRPIITDTLALKTARHPLLDKVCSCPLEFGNGPVVDVKRNSPMPLCQTITTQPRNTASRLLRDRI